MTHAPTAPAPARLGKYQLQRELGRGAMGVVYEGWDAVAARPVALKTVRRDQLDGGEAAQILSRFKREAEAAGRLAHPNVVAVYEYGEDPDGTAFIAMEYVAGRELKDCFDRRQRFPLGAAVRLMEQILAALGHAHGHGIVHRDVKPANIFILADGSAKVGDFGIARIESSTLTRVGSVLGTPAYMAPEQFMGQPVDRRADLFAAGVILYQFLTGEKPFVGQLTALMQQVLKADPAPPSSLDAGIPAAFDAIIRKALAKQPADRYQSAAEFATALRSALAEAPAADALPKLPADPEPAGPIQPQTRAVPQPPPRRRVAVWLAAAGAAIAIAAAVGLWRAKTATPARPAAMTATATAT